MDKSSLVDLLEKNKGALYHQTVCAVSKNGEQIFEHGVNCEMDAIFDLASVSKIITGTSVFKLISNGSLGLLQTAAELFQAESRDFGPRTKELFNHITLKSLLAHSSGLPAWFPFYTQKGSFWEVLEIALNKYPVETGPVYSDLGFMLLGKAICAASGRGLEHSLKELNADLGTSFVYNPHNPEDCVETERGNRIETKMCADRDLSFEDFRNPEINIRGQVNDGNAFYFWQGTAGHAGVFGTAKDLLKLGGLYLNDGIVNGNEVIRADIIKESIVDYGGSRGLMWDLSDIFIKGFGHTGFTGTSLYICPEKSIAAVILTSRLVIEPAPNLRPFRLEAHDIIYRG